jgi:hypothetical protein
MTQKDDHRPGISGHQTPPITGAAKHLGPGPFVTRVIHVLEDGRHLVATSRRTRKGLSSLVVEGAHPFLYKSTSVSAWRHLWLPARIGWWVALLFVVGSSCFVAGGFFATWPRSSIASGISASALGWIFFVGSLFFTGAAYLQLVEAANADVTAVGANPRHRSWFGWRPRNLGWLASAVQLAGTVMFNFNTADAMLSGLSWRGEDLVVWTPDIVGCTMFLIASVLAWVEFSHGMWSFAPRSVSWWIVALNGLGSVAFFASSVNAYVGPGGPHPEELWLDGFFTFLGAALFLVASLLLFPELADD